MPRPRCRRRWASFNLQKDPLDELRIGSRVELLPATLPINAAKLGDERWRQFVDDTPCGSLLFAHFEDVPLCTRMPLSWPFFF
jgi:hypothetical protein